MDDDDNDNNNNNNIVSKKYRVIEMSLCTCARSPLRGEVSYMEYPTCHMPVGLTSTITLTVNTVHSL